jgi:hypothetical protein
LRRHRWINVSQLVEVEGLERARIRSDNCRHLLVDILVRRRWSNGRCRGSGGRRDGGGGLRLLLRDGRSAVARRW